MRRWGFILALLLAVPAVGEEEQPVSLEQLVADAEAKAAAGDLAGAGEILRGAAETQPEALLQLGRILEDHHDTDNAIDVLKSAAEKLSGPARGEALGRLSVAQELRGMPEAGASAQAAIEADPEGAWPSLAMARQKAAAGEGEAAVALARKAVAAGGGAPASAALGYALEVSGDLAGAETAYHEASAAAPEDSMSQIGLARLLRKTGRAAEARPILDKVLDLSPGAIAAYKESARVNMALDRPDQAMGDAATAAALAEQDPEAQRLVQQVTVAQALARIANNQAGVAIQDLNALRDQHPDLPEVYYGLGKAYEAQKNYDEAIAQLRKAIELDPKLAEAQYELGHVLHTFKGDAKGALPAYEAAVELAPGNTEYRTNLGNLLTQLGQTDRAIEELKRVVESPGYNRPEAWIYLGGAYVNAKKYQDAIAALDKSLDMAPDVAQTHAYLAWAYFGLKDSENFVKEAGKAKSLGYNEATLMGYYERVKGGEEIK
jgi:tetratricopeptide (TPR) repeat protein